jgi:hypothetical protein
MAQPTQVRAASRESKEIDFGGLIDIQIQLSTATCVITVNFMNIGGLQVYIAALMLWPLHPRGKSPTK